MTLEEKLALSKKVNKLEESGIQKIQKIQTNPQPRTISGNVKFLDNLVYGENFVGDAKDMPYSPEDEMKRIKQGLPEDLSKCRLPKQILESIKENPLTDLSADPQMDAFTKKLASVIPNNGLQKSVEIQKKLDNNDKKIVTENTQYNINVEDIKTIIRDTIKEEISALKENLLNESKNNKNTNNLKAMSIGVDKFLFLDSDNNVYECKLTYKGKNKKRN